MTKSDRRILWRKGGKWSEDRTEGARAYGDFRAYEEVGGGREALAQPGSTWGTTDPEVAVALYDARVEELRAKRQGRVGVRQNRTTTLAELIRHHLIMKAKAGKTSRSHLEGLEQRLGKAVAFFGAGRDPRSIEPSEVREWSDHLADGGSRKPGTVRHYLNALSGLYGRAQEGLWVEPGYNPVSMLSEKPTGSRTREEAAFFEVPDAALLLEAARALEERDRVNATPGFHAIVATFLLTGGRKSEVLGLDVADVSFDRGVIRFRPNEHRNLKTSTSHRVVPIWPQLRVILQQWIFGGDSPHGGGLLFPAPHGGMVGSLRKSFDAMGALCGFEEGEIRTRPFRHTYCSARLQTVQRIVKPGKDPATDPDPYEWVEVSKFTVQKEMGHGGAQLVDRIYGHMPRNPHRSEVVEYRIEKHREDLGERLAAVEATR